jgi:hypothetical protein
MLSDSAASALRDIAHHLELTTSFAAGLDFERFRDDPRTVYTVARGFPQPCAGLFHWQARLHLAAEPNSEPDLRRSDSAPARQLHIRPSCTAAYAAPFVALLKKTARTLASGPAPLSLPRK